MDFLNDLDAAAAKWREGQNANGMGTLSGLSNVLKNAAPSADAGTSKVPLTLLPAGVQPGQRVSLTVTGIDPISGMATVVPDAVQEAVPPAPAMPAMDAVDASLTMGPMDKLKSYLFQKTQDQEEL